MITKMSELPLLHQTIPLWALTKDGHYCLIDGQKNTTGHDIMVLFSEQEKATRYAAQYPSLREAELASVTIAELVQFFAGRVEYFILDRP